MSRAYPIEPPPRRGTKYHWSSSVLVYSPITSEVPGLGWSQGLWLSVDKDEGGYRGSLVFDSINGGPSIRKKTRLYKKLLTACLAIERVGDELLKADREPWMKRALELGWRPPPG